MEVKDILNLKTILQKVENFVIEKIVLVFDSVHLALTKLWWFASRI